MSGPRLWGGRQSGALDPAFEAFNRSLPFDRRLVDEDLVGSMAWARALGGAGVLESADVDALVAALAELRDGLCEGCFVNLPKNIVVRLARGMELVQCPSCDRILYSL